MNKSLIAARASTRCLILAFALVACEGQGPVSPGPAPGRPSGSGGAGGAPTGSGGAGGRSALGASGGSGPALDGGAAAGGAGGTAPDASPAPRRDVRADPPADAAVIPTDVAPRADGGSMPSSDLDQRCTVPVTFTNPDPGSEGSKIFAASVPDAVSAMQAHARAICRILYRKVEEVKNVRQQRLTVEPSAEIAFAAGGNITFGTQYIADFARGKSKAAIDAELNGVLVHEGTHVWQYTNGGGALVEAMADYVRFKAGFYTLARRQRGGNWNQPYTTGGFFIAWVEEKYDPDYGYKLNMGMKDRGFSYPAFVQQITGKSIDAVWAEYQAAIR